MSNLYSILEANFPADRSACAIESRGAGEPLFYSWADLHHGSGRIANLLAALNLPAGSRLAAQVDKSVEALMLYLACLRAGIVYVPLNTAYRKAEVEYFIGDAKPAVVVCTPANFSWVGKAAFCGGAEVVYTLGDDRGGTLLDRAAHHADDFVTVDRADADLAVLLYTSGTTGRSKGAMLSHGNMASNALALRSLWGWHLAPDGTPAERDTLLHALPLFHIHGLFVAAHGALIAGAKQIFLPRLDPAAILDLLPRCTVMMGVPTYYVRLLAEPGLTPERCAGMRLFVSGSAPLLKETFELWRERTGHVILERYGMSETVMNTSNPYDGDPALRKPGTVGPAIPGVGVRVVDGRTDQPLPAGEIGDIQISGPNVFGGYWQMPDKTAESFTADGWFRTGDVGRLDDDGYLSIVGRSKDLIITGGYNVYPKEIESFIDEMPGVAESAVIGVPHADFGEAVVAVVVPRPDAVVDEAALIAALKAGIANYKVPKRVFTVDELPRNTMGKVQKNLLRERFGAGAD
ncbi:malonate--CoA ligase [Derxia gummosa]|uniref:Malonate--CoA ligase n=1 Tax=Derxia gummosa DSM 723 TaxID=1121388 RepID=A0A8B6X2V4_9BURK|nr:malonyl-CoA synthase [Derxia gummosa]